MSYLHVFTVNEILLYTDTWEKASVIVTVFSQLSGLFVHFC